MATSRLTLKKEIYFIIFHEMLNILCNSWSKNKIIKLFFDNCTIELSDDNDVSLNYFDIAILHALNTIYIQTNGVSRFSVLNILKLITSNSRAHFSLDSKKNKTISELAIIESIKKLSKFKFISIAERTLENQQLISLVIEDEYLEFDKKPALVEIYNKKIISSISLEIIPYDALIIKPKKKKYVHQTTDVIAFKSIIICSVLESNSLLEIEVDKLKTILGIKQIEVKLYNDYKGKNIAYELFNKKLKALNRRFFTCFFNPYLDHLKEHKLIDQYTTTLNTVTIYMQ